MRQADWGRIVSLVEGGVSFRSLGENVALCVGTMGYLVEGSGSRTIH